MFGNPETVKKAMVLLAGHNSEEEKTLSEIVQKTYGFVFAEVLPIMSDHAYELDTKFGDAKTHIDEIEKMTGKKIIHTLQDAEPIGPKHLTDILIVAPCSRKYYCKTCKFNNR